MRRLDGSRLPRWALGGLLLLPGIARADPAWMHGHGLLVSWDDRSPGPPLTRRLGIGVESSINVLEEVLIGAGAVLQLEIDLAGGVRLAAVGQGYLGPFGAEVGPAVYLTPERDWQVELQFAPYLSMGFVTTAARFLLSPEGVHVGGSVALKLHYDEDGGLLVDRFFGGGCDEPLVDGEGQAQAICGRPLRLADDRPWRAPVVIAGPARRGPLAAAADALDPAERRRLAAAWLDDARDEHAAIAAFRQLAVHLAVHGAPQPLVAGALRSAADEVGHARRAFAIASALAGYRLSPLPLPAPRRPVPSRAELAAESWLDGAMNEGRAAAEAAVGHGTAQVPAVRALLRAIGREEARHAALGAAVAEWAAGQGVDARRALERAKDIRAAVERPVAATARADRVWGQVAAWMTTTEVSIR